MTSVVGSGTGVEPEDDREGVALIVRSRSIGCEVFAEAGRD
jgi:hypothetical protein